MEEIKTINNPLALLEIAASTNINNNEMLVRQLLERRSPLEKNTILIELLNKDAKDDHKKKLKKRPRNVLFISKPP